MEYYRRARRQHFREASAGIIRSVLIQLEEEMKVVEKVSGEDAGECCRTAGLDRIAGLSSCRRREDDEE
jgi:ribosomal protein S19E (S16A)